MPRSIRLVGPQLDLVMVHRNMNVALQYTPGPAVEGSSSWHARSSATKTPIGVGRERRRTGQRMHDGEKPRRARRRKTGNGPNRKSVGAGQRVAVRGSVEGRSSRN